MRKKNEKLIILWPKSEDCNISYKDVFSEKQFEDIPLLRVVELEIRKYKSIPELMKRKKIREITEEIVYRLKYGFKIGKLKRGRKYIDYFPASEIGIAGNLYTEKVCWTKYLKMVGEKKEVFIRAFCNIIGDDRLREEVRLDVIKFNPKYEQRAKEIVSGNKRWIGIHIRRTDHKTAIEKSKTEDFIRLMQAEQEKEPEVTFFLATDDPMIEEELKGYFGSKIVTQTVKIWGRDTGGGIESAIIDCLCLSRCNKIFGSYTSVFSFFSAAYGNKELIICKEN